MEQLFRDYPYFESLMLKDAAITSHIDYGKHLMKIWAVYKTAFKSVDIFRRDGLSFNRSKFPEEILP